MFICARVCVCVYVYWLVGSLYIFLSFTSLFFCVSQIERRVFESGKSPSVFAESTEKTKTKKRIFTGFMGTELIALHELRCYDRCLHVLHWWLTLLLLLLYRCLCCWIFASLNLILSVVGVCVSDVYVCIHCDFSSRHTHTHTRKYSHTQRDYILVFFSYLENNIFTFTYLDREIKYGYKANSIHDI